MRRSSPTREMASELLSMSARKRLSLARMSSSADALSVTPDARAPLARGGRGSQVLPQPGNFVGRPNVPEVLRQQIGPGAAIEPNGRFVYPENAERFNVKDVRRQRSAVKE